MKNVDYVRRKKEVEGDMHFLGELTTDN